MLLPSNVSCYALLPLDCDFLLRLAAFHHVITLSSVRFQSFFVSIKTLFNVSENLTFVTQQVANTLILNMSISSLTDLLKFIFVVRSKHFVKVRERLWSGLIEKSVTLHFRYNM